MKTNFTRNKPMSFGEILEYVTETTDITTVQEIAIVGGVKTSTVYGYRSDETIPKYTFVKAVNRFLIEEKGCYIIQDQFRPRLGKQATPDGSTLDEMRDMIASMNHVEEHESHGEHQKALDDVSRMRELCDCYEAEIIARMR